MNAHAHGHGADAHSHGHGAEDHAHPTPGTYLKVAVVLFILTALEVLAYELARRPGAPLHEVVGPIVVPILLVLSAAKFALVAMFYMHLKQDPRLFSNLFVWPIVIAATVIVSLIVIIRYWYFASY
jgi:caa(3)-type oxidase subunit IV